MSENYENNLMEVSEIEEYEASEGRDFSTAIGVGLIAGAGVLVFEGGKKVVKVAAPRAKALWHKIRPPKEAAAVETPPAENPEVASKPPEAK